MRTINKSHQKRLIAQREEAKLQGFEKVAKQLAEQISSNPTRENDEEYEYSFEDLLEDVTSSIRDATLRIQDYYGGVADQRDTEDLIEEICEEMTNRIGDMLGVDIGAYEPKTPGEDGEEVVELEEEEK